MRLGVLTCIWKRHELAEAMLAHTLAIAREVALEDIVLELVAVVSPDDPGAEALVWDAGYPWEAVVHANQPLSDKWNAGMDEFAGEAYEPSANIDAVVILGSDDFVTADLFRCWAKHLRDGWALLGVKDAYTFRPGDGRLVHYPGYGPGPRQGESLGTGRCLSRKLLQALEWKPWPEGLASGLDAGMMKRCEALGVGQELVLPMAAGPGPILDVRVESDVCMSVFESYAETGRPVGPLAVLSKFPSATIAKLAEIADPVRACTKVFTGTTCARKGVVCLIVKNESTRLRRCLESVAKVARDCIVLDTGSSDKTVEVAEACGARVERYDGAASGVDFSSWRNCILWIARSAGFSRVLMIDADQVLVEPGNLATWLEGDGYGGACSVRIEALAPNGHVETWRSVQGMSPADHGFEYPVHNQLRGVVDPFESTAVFQTSYASNARAKARRSLPVLRRFIRDNPLNPHGYFYAARHAKSLSWLRLAHRMNLHVVALAPRAVEYATAWPDLVTSTVILEGIEAAEAVLTTAKGYHPGLDELWRVAVALDGVRWTETSRNPGPYAFLPRVSERPAAAFPRIAQALNLPLWWQQPADEPSSSQE
jgi:hypothetical protein